MATQRMVRTWDKPEPGTKAIARTGGGDYVIDGTTGTWTRKRSAPEQVEKVLREEFARCGFTPKTIKVRPYGEKSFILHLGALRNLDPNVVYRALTEQTVNGKGKTVKRYPDKCGSRRVLEGISRLPRLVSEEPVS